MNINAFGNSVGQMLGFGRDKTNYSSGTVSPGFVIQNLDYSSLEEMESKRSANDRWTDASLYSIDINSPKGYTVNSSLLNKVRERLENEGIDADSRTPTHEITDEQMEWLGERYDLDFLSVCSFSHSEYGNFMLDLAYLNIFSLDEVENMFGVLPFNSNNKAILYYHGDPKNGSGAGYVSSDGSIVEDYQDLLAQMNTDHLKSQNTDKTDALKLIITEFFARYFENRKNAMANNSLTYPMIEDASEKLKEDFGKTLE